MTKGQREHESLMQVGWVLACLESKIGPIPKVIPLTQNQYMLVDSDDYERLNEHKWQAQWNPPTKSFYATRAARDPLREGKRIVLRSHRVVLGLPYRHEGYDGDHINHVTLDNRKKNLRICSRRENMENLSNQSKYGAGIGRDDKSARNPFYAEIHVKKRKIHIGYFPTVEEARTARQEFIEGKRSARKKKNSPYGVGVYRHSRRTRRPFQASIAKDGKLLHIGYFDTPEDARIAREIMRKDT